MCLEKHRSLGLLGEPDAPDARHEAARHEIARHEAARHEAAGGPSGPIGSGSAPARERSVRRHCSFIHLLLKVEIELKRHQIHDQNGLASRAVG